MSFVKEVSCYDEQHCHWVAEVSGCHEWDAMNQDWIMDQQIGWYSTKGLENTGKVTFQFLKPNQNAAKVYITNNCPPAAPNDIGEKPVWGSGFTGPFRQNLINLRGCV